MNLSLFIARRIYQAPSGHPKVSRPAIRIATLGVAIGLAVMLLTVAVVQGFKHTIRDKVVGFGSHIQVMNFLTMQTSDPYPICIDDSLSNVLTKIDGIKHVERYALTQGMLKTDNDFMGIIFKGIGQEYDTGFLKNHLLEGEVPQFSDSKNQQKLLLSKVVADRLNLKAGSKVYAYFIYNNNVRARRFTVSGIFETNMSQFDQNLCFTDLYTAVKLNGWQKGDCTGAELLVDDFEQLETTAQNVIDKVNRTVDHNAATITSQTIYEAYPQIFSWLNLLDVNVWIILALMVSVAGFTMISGLLIIILERTQMIGIFKAMGSRNSTIRHIFLWFSVFIIGKGLVWGNLIGIGLILLQQYTGIVKLDPATYYVSTAPLELDIPLVLLLNAATLLVCIFVLIAPSFLISHIHPAKSMRYE